MLASDSSSLETLHKGRDAEVLRGRATDSGGTLGFSTSSHPKIIPNTGGKPNAKLIKGSEINKSLDGGVAAWG